MAQNNEQQNVIDEKLLAFADTINNLEIDDWFEEAGKLGPQSVFVSVDPETLQFADEIAERFEGFEELSETLRVQHVVPSEEKTSPLSAKELEKLASTLRLIVSVFKPEEGQGLRASILVRDEYRTMVAVVLLNEALKPYFEQTQPTFFWQEPIQSIAALCMHLKRSVRIPNLEDTSDRFSKFWVRPNSTEKRSGGIIAVPVLEKSSQVVVAVLSITSTEPGFFKSDDEMLLNRLVRSDLIVEPITRYARGLGLDLESYNKSPMEFDHSVPEEAQNFQVEKPDVFQWYLDGLIEALSGLSEHERVAAIEKLAGSEVGQVLMQVDMPEHEWIAPETVRDALADVINAQSDPNTEPGRRPAWAKRIAGVVNGRENEFISLNDLASAFVKSKPEIARKTAASAVSWLNTQLREIHADVELVSDNPNRFRDSQTYYHFRHPHK